MIILEDVVCGAVELCSIYIHFKYMGGTKLKTVSIKFVHFNLNKGGIYQRMVVLDCISFN